MSGKPQGQGKPEGTRDSGPPLFANWSFGTHAAFFFLDTRCQNGGRAASPAQKILLVLIRKKCCLFAIKDKERERENNSLALFFSFNHKISWNIFKRLYHTILGASNFHNVRRAATE